MTNNCEINLKLLWIVFGIFACFPLSWCWNSWSGDDIFSINEHWFNLNYNGNIKFERLQLKTNDLDEIIDLYQEAWDDLKYRDSLLFAEKYSQWLWANAFAQGNLDNLVAQWLTISGIKKIQISLKKYWENINMVLVEYEISKWLINDIPLLYVSQLFVPQGENILLMSFITEDKSSRSSVSNMFKNIK